LKRETPKFRELNQFKNWILSIRNKTTKAILDNDENLDTDNTTIKISKELLIYTTNDKNKGIG
jgi:hypothetical protein